MCFTRRRTEQDRTEGNKIMSDAIESTTVEDEVIPGLRWRVRVFADYDYQEPGDYGDGFTDKQVAAFKRGDWYFVYVTVTPKIGAVEYGEANEGTTFEYGEYLHTDEDDNVTGREYIDLDSMLRGGRRYNADADGHFTPQSGVTQTEACLGELFAEARYKLADVLDKETDNALYVLRKLRGEPEGDPASGKAQAALSGAQAALEAILGDSDYMPLLRLEVTTTTSA